jgi:hypothetical protein
MYSDAIIDTLETRVGWALPINSDFPFAIDALNMQTDSGRYFQFFHMYVTVENVLATLPNRNETEVEFNQFLKDLRRQAVYDALVLVIDQDPNYDSTVAHDTYITQHIRLFDDVIGYCVAKKVIQLLLMSIRSNRIERISADVLSYELSGKKGTVEESLDDSVNAAHPPFNKQIVIYGDKIW